ncbi:MAG: AmmeMemoRadiSam system radical SAM enzyme [Calditrichota bacterium]
MIELSNLTQIPPPLVDAAFQTRMGNRIRCDICPQLCKLDEGEVGICGGRQVVNGQFWAMNYGQVCSLHLDAIEKKPLYHFYPGSEILSVGPNGCNLSCQWCQNWQISQNPAPTRTILPQDLANMVDALDGIGAAYTFAEPLIWFEFVRDAGRILHERGLVNVFITNGYVNPEPLRELLPLADAFNVDLKASDDRCYRDFCGGHLEDVQRTIRMVYDAGKHVEITHLLVTNVTASMERLEHLVDWIAAIDPNIPLHLSRYFPSHRFNEPPTAIEFMLQAYEAARAKLTWVYLGNLWIGKGQSSYCPQCGELLVERGGLSVEIGALKGDVCGKCGAKLNFLSAKWD